MRNYTALCVGGPRAGQMLTHNSPVAAFCVNPRISETLLSEVEAASINADTAQYVFTHISGPETSLDIWRWSELSTQDALKRMAEAYVSAHSEDQKG